MKKIFLCLLMLSVSLISFAQKTIEEGVITYSMTMDGLPEDDPSASMLSNMTMKMISKNNKMRITMDMGIAKTDVLMDFDKKTNTMLMDLMGQKMAISIDETPEEEVDNKKIDFVKTKDTKKILGYQCAKYVFKTEDGEEMVYWVNEELSFKNKNPKDKLANSIPGIPMEYNMEQNGMQIKLNVTDINLSSVSENEFAIPSDYEKLTMEEFQTKMANFGK